MVELDPKDNDHLILCLPKYQTRLSILYIFLMITAIFKISVDVYSLVENTLFFP